MSRALLIFARRPRPGRVKTRLSPLLSPVQAAELYECMVRDSIEQTSLLEVDARVLFYEDLEDAAAYFREIDKDLTLLPQAGAGLGERLSDACAQVFRRGFRTAAVIGTDSPDLPVRYIREAFQRLEKGAADVVFGPAEDGGYYLVALQAPQPELFRDIPWSTGTVLEKSLQQAASAGLRPFLLPVWYDIDEPSDLLRITLHAEGTGAARTRRFLQELLPLSPLSQRLSQCGQEPLVILP